MISSEMKIKLEAGIESLLYPSDNPAVNEERANYLKRCYSEALGKGATPYELADYVESYLKNKHPYSSRAGSEKAQRILRMVIDDNRSDGR